MPPIHMPFFLDAATLSRMRGRPAPGLPPTISACKSHSGSFWRTVVASCLIHPSCAAPSLGRSAPAANSPKKRGPDQCAPVIFLAILVRDGSHKGFSGKSTERCSLVRMRYAIAGTIAALRAFAAAPVRADDDLMKRALMDFKPIPSVVPAVKDNAVTHEKVGLGRLLFFDPRLSASEIISCNTCHNLGTGGVDAGPTSVGHGWQKGPRRAPTVYNAVFNVAQFWDGRAADLKAQAKGLVQASVEMNATPEHVVKTLWSMPDYVALFKKAFPNEASPVTFDNFAKAIEAFEATLI